MAALTPTRRVRTRARSERGAEIIELMLVTPIFLLLVGAIFDFGFLFRNWEVVTNAAREGARIGVLPEYKCDGTTTDVRDRVRAYMTASGVSDVNSYTVTAQNQVLVTPAGKFNSCFVRVELTQSMPSLSVFSTLVGGTFGNVPVRGVSTMRTEAQAAP